MDIGGSYHRVCNKIYSQDKVTTYIKRVIAKR